MDLASEIYIKAELLVEGVRLEEAALEGVGTLYKENAYLIFDYNPEGTRALFPSDCRLPLGTVAPIRINSRSPYLIRKEDGTLSLEKGGRQVTTLEWLKRPRFYGRLTSDGVEMRRVGQLVGECGLNFCFSNYCSNWDDGKQCRFCNINATKKFHKDSILSRKTSRQIGEVVAAALEEGLEIHLLLTGGSLPGRKAEDIIVGIMEEIKEHVGSARFPVCANMAPPLNLEQIDRLHQAGVTTVAYDLEVWNQNLFKAICPGKSEKIGREGFLKALEYAVPLLGQGYSVSNFVQGLEEKENYFEAAHYLASKGIFMSLQPWFPALGSKLEGHRAPHAEWMTEVTEKVIAIQARVMPEILGERFFSSGALGCYRCFPIGLFWDEIRRRSLG